MKSVKSDVKRVLTALTAVLALGASGHAQTTQTTQNNPSNPSNPSHQGNPASPTTPSNPATPGGTSLPLTSIGDKLLWTVGDQELNLIVPGGGPLKLELYSPRLDQSDYRSDTYYGDEQYDGNKSQVTTTFTLLRPDGTELLTQAFTPGQHAWEALLEQDLPAGTYRLKAVTQGNGKNTFAVRLSGTTATLQAETLTVNLRSREWLPVLNLNIQGPGEVLRMYDGDGTGELEAQLRDAQGQTFPLVVSADLDLNDLNLPERPGAYTLELRQPKTAKQYSNAVGFRLTRAGTVSPITLAAVTMTTATGAGAEQGAGQGAVTSSPAPTESTTPAQAATSEGNPAAQAPVVQRRSTVNLPFDAPVQAREVVIAHTLPAGATFVPGSSRLNGQGFSDPKRGPSGTLYWVIPAPSVKVQAAQPGQTAQPGQGDQPGQESQDSQAKERGLPSAFGGVITYTLTHAEALPDLPAASLMIRLAGERTDVLSGKVDVNDWRAAQALGQAQPVTENAGAIKQPIAGSEIRLRERINVVVEVPLNQTPTLSVNGQVMPADLIGETTNDGPRGLTRVTYVGVPLQLGPNTLQVGTDTVQVQRIGGTERIEIVPVSLIADGSTPVQLKFRALDAFGKPTAQTLLSIRTNLEPRTPDASPGDADYQVRLEDGEGLLELQPQPTPTTLKLQVQQGDDGEDVETHTFEVKPDQQRVGVGVLSATLGLDGNLSLQNLQDDLTWQARANYEGPLGEGKLYLAADKDGLPTDRDTLKRYSVYGDSSVESIPLQGIDPVAMRYDHPSFRVQYSRNPLPIDVLPVGEQLTALTGYSKSNPQVSGFVAFVPADRIAGERVTPEGTRLLRLAHGGISAGSETLEVITYERLPGTATQTGKELKRVPLSRNIDYQLDLRTGIVTLARALDHLDENLNEVVVLASYRLDNPLGKRELAYGAQVKYETEQASAGVAVVNLDGRTTYGARATYNNGTLRAEGLVAYSGGLQASADVAALLGDDTFQARVRYRDPAYQGLAPYAAGLSATASYDARLGDHLGATLQADYQKTPNSAGGTSPNGTASTSGSVTGRVQGTWEPFSVGAGLKYAFGKENGLGGVFSAGYHKKPLDLDVIHTQPFSGNLAPTTNFTAKYALTERVSLGFTDLINWKTGHTAALTLDTRLGNTNYQLAYDLPNSGGLGNRARFGVTTSLNLSEHLTAGLHGNVLYNLTAQDTELSAGGDLRYKTERMAATTGADVVLNSKGVGVVLRSGISGTLNDHLTLSADGLAEFGAGKNGQRAALGYAYRNRNLVSLGTARYVNGTLAGNQPEFTTNLSAEYRQVHWSVRGNFDTRTLLKDKDSFTWQAGVNGSVYLTKDFGLGAWGHMITNPATQNTQYGYGLEGSLRVLPGSWFTVGYNPVGFNGIGYSYTKRGAYVRLDLTVDEMVGGNK